MGRPMGLGALGSPNILIKRKFQWTFTIDTCKGEVPESFVKIAARPNLSLEEIEINFLNGKTFLPGKATWDTITVTYIDVANGQGTGSGDPVNLYSWLATVYDFTSPETLHMASKRSEYAGRARLSVYDGCGNTLETWTMGDMWPTNVNWGDTDYASSDEMTIELTLRYSQVAYQNYCGTSIQPCPCTGC